MIRDVIKLMMYDDDNARLFYPRQWLRPEERSGYGDGDPITTWVDHSTYHTDADGTYNNIAPDDNAPTQDETESVNGYPSVLFTPQDNFGAGTHTGQWFDLNVDDDMAGAAMEMLIVVRSGVTGSGFFQGGYGSWLMSDGSDFAAQYNESNANTILESFGTTIQKNCGAAPFDLGQWNIYQVYSANNDWACFLNGELVFDTATNTVSSWAVALGWSGVIPVLTGAYLKGWAEEYILWDYRLESGAVMTGKRLAAFEYARDKYDLGQELPPISGGLTDDFNNAGLWQVSGVTVTPTATQVEISGTTTAHLRTVSSYNMTTKAAAVHFTALPAPSANYGQQLVVSIDDTFANCYVVYLENGILSFIRGVAAAYTTVFSLTFDDTLHSYVRLRFAGGIAYFDTSADGSTWTQRSSESAAITITALYVYCRTTNTGTSVTQTWDDFVSDL